MEDLKNIYVDFIRAQGEFKSIKKTHSVSMKDRKYGYSSFQEVVESILPILNRNGIGVIQIPTVVDKGVNIETILIHVSGERMNCGNLFIPIQKRSRFENGVRVDIDLNAQDYGSGISYGKRYALMSICCVASSDEDDDAVSISNISSKEVTTTQPYNSSSNNTTANRLASEAQIKFIKNLISQRGLPEADFELSEKVKLSEMTSSHASAIIKKLQEAQK